MSANPVARPASRRSPLADRRPSLTAAARAVLVPLLLAAAGARADTPPVVDCPWYLPTGGDAFGVRGFYSPGLGERATSLGQVTLYLAFPAPGTYQLSLTATVGTFDGTVLGTATASPVASGTDPLAVVFDFGGIALTSPNPTVAFKGTVVAKPTGVTGDVVLQTATDPACPLFETTGTDAPLSSYRRGGIATTITGTLSGTFHHRVTVPAVASIHGANGTFFHTDAWLHNGGAPITVTATYRCYLGQSCGGGPVTFTLGASASKTFSDLVGTLFNAPETAGAVEFEYVGLSTNNQLKVVTRTYTPSLPSPTDGASLDGLIFIQSTGNATFVGLGNNGGDRSAGFRSNVGVYNPTAYATTVTFTLQSSAGAAIGQPVTQTWAPHEARQINDVFAAAGAGSTVTTDAVLHVTSTIAVFPYVTVIDNVTGDSVIQEE